MSSNEPYLCVRLLYQNISRMFNMILDPECYDFGGTFLFAFQPYHNILGGSCIERGMKPECMSVIAKLTKSEEKKFARMLLFKSAFSKITSLIPMFYFVF